MKILSTLCLSILFFSAVAGQTVRLTGTVYDRGGSLAPGILIAATDSKGKLHSAKTGSEGDYILPLEPGIYAVEVTGPGFLKIKYPELLIVNSTLGKMNQDFIVFGRKDHEPCGYSGADCLPKEDLINSYTVTYSPTLQGLWKRF